MNRISKSVGLSLCGLVLANLSMSEVHGQTAPVLVAPEGLTQADSQLISDGVMKITIISGASIAGVSASRFAREQNAIATARTDVHGQSVYSGPSSALLANARSPGQPTAGEIILRGTAPGDVIRLEYRAHTEEAFAQAIADLKESTDTWTARVSDLTKQSEFLSEQKAEARQTLERLSLNDQSANDRYLALNKLERLEKELKIVERNLADADMRMHNVRGQYAAGARNLQVTRETHRVLVDHVIIDTYVDGRPGQIDAILNRAVGETTIAAKANRAIPHIRVTRIKSANSEIVSRSVRNVRAGLWAVGVSAALILEEVTVGAISENLAEKTKTHYSPQTRIEPTGAPGRRY